MIRRLAQPLPELAAALELRPHDELLNVACGSGEFLAVHGAQAQQVAGIDVSEEKVTLARERLANRIASGTPEVAQGDAAALPWADDTVSAVTSWARSKTAPVASPG